MRKKNPKHAETNYAITKSMRDQVSLVLLLMELLAWQRKQSCSQMRNQVSRKNFWIACNYLLVVEGKQRLKINFNLYLLYFFSLAQC